MRHRCWRVILGICEHCDPNRLRWTRLDKAHCFKKPQTLEREKRLVVSPEGTLIPSMLLPAHCIAWLCCHWCENHSTVTGISMCVCPSACSTHLVAGGGVGCNCVVFSQFFFFKCHYNALFVPVHWTSCLNCIWAPVQAARVPWMKGAVGFFLNTAHLNCMSLLLCCDLP